MNRLVFCIGLLLVLSFAVLFIFPVYWMLIGSLQGEMYAVKLPPVFWPRSPNLDSYMRIIKHYGFISWVRNTLIVSACGTFGAVLMACLAGYVFAKKEFPGKQFLFWLALMLLMIPFYVTIIPLYITVHSFGLYDTVAGVFLPGLVGVGSMFLSRQYISVIPNELIDSAKIDGASEFGVFRLVILPLCKPLIATLCIINFVHFWRAYFWPLVISGSNASRTLSVAVAMVACASGDLIDVGLAMAGASMVMIPIFIVFFSFQKYFIKGITMGGVKG